MRGVITLSIKVIAPESVITAWVSAPFYFYNDKTKRKTLNDENLKPCKPGETHNPNGRPKGSKNISTYLRKLLEKSLEIHNPISGQKEKKKIAEILAIKLATIALKGEGDRLAINDVIDRLEGKPLQKQESNVKIEKVEVEFVNSENDGNSNTQA